MLAHLATARMRCRVIEDYQILQTDGEDVSTDKQEQGNEQNWRTAKSKKQGLEILPLFGQMLSGHVGNKENTRSNLRHAMQVLDLKMYL